MAHPVAPRWPAWRNGYRRVDLRDDALAGSTLAAYAMPSSIAYAQLAGMPVQTGLYCYLFAGIAYALVGIVAPARRGADLVHRAHAGGHARRARARRSGPLRAAGHGHARSSLGSTALFCGLMRWGGIVHFISETVLTGFKIGAGIVIGISQLPLLFGLAGSQGDMWRTLAHIATNIGGIHLPSLVARRQAAFLVLQIGPRGPAALADSAHRGGALPAAHVAARDTRMVDRHRRHHPRRHSVAERFPPSTGASSTPCCRCRWHASCCAYNEGIAAARLLALRHDNTIDPNREL